MSHPLLLEINTRAWLGALSDQAGQPVTLATVPDECFAEFSRLGFTHLWLMGVWQTGVRARAFARQQIELRRLCAQHFPAPADNWIEGSPYAVAQYAAAEEFGGPNALREFRARLNKAGLKLILDYVPNHVGLDHQWIIDRPDLFMRRDTPGGDTFFVRAKDGSRWFVYGKDPNFPAWRDTVQLDFRRDDTRAAMIDTLQAVAAECDGARCDLAMLLLSDIFERTWKQFPSSVKPAEGEFWAGAIASVKKTRPDFLFIGEAYWNTEQRLQQLGFDYTYDKVFYDLALSRDHEELKRHLEAVGADTRAVRFLENHDEERVAGRLSLAEQKAAALLLLSQPCMRLIYQGQTEGRRLRTPVQLKRFLPEKPDPEIAAFYEEQLVKSASPASCPKTVS